MDISATHTLVHTECLSYFKTLKQLLLSLLYLSLTQYKGKYISYNVYFSEVIKEVPQPLRTFSTIYST
jgi:hypothetical protein